MWQQWLDFTKFIPFTYSGNAVYANLYFWRIAYSVTNLLELGGQNRYTLPLPGPEVGNIETYLNSAVEFVGYCGKSEIISTLLMVLCKANIDTISKQHLFDFTSVSPSSLGLEGCRWEDFSSGTSI